MATVYVTKWALTRGVSKEDNVEIKNGYAVRSPGFCMSPDYLHVKMDKDAFLTEEEAKKRAIHMANSRLESLAKERDKLKEWISVWRR